MGIGKSEYPSKVWKSVLRKLPSRIAAPVYYRIANYGDRLRGFRRADIGNDLTVNLCPDDGMHKALGYLGFYEPRLTKELRLLGNSGGMLVDVGANIGYFTLTWLSANRSNTVVAIEAAPNNARLLQENIACNGFDDRATVYSQACGERATALLFSNLWGHSNSGCGGFVNSHECANAVPVDIVALDDLFAQDANEIAVLKIDTEGADTLVLKGASDLLRQKRIRRIFFEQNYWRMDALGISRGEAIVHLEAHGYVVRLFDGAGSGLEEFVAWPQ